MAHTVVGVFTSKNLTTILSQGGSQAWRLDVERARRSEFLLCVQNRRHPAFKEPGAPHGAGFLLGRIADVVPAPADAGRWLITISEFVEIEIPNIWRQRYPVRYTTLEELGIDPATLPPFQPVQPRGFREMAARPLLAPGATRPDTQQRMDAILAQIDRIPDLTAPFDPLDWDAHGLPR